MTTTSTETIQNSLSRLEREVHLDIFRPKLNLRRSYHKAVMSLRKAIHDFDVVNDMKVEHRELEMRAGDENND